ELRRRRRRPRLGRGHRAPPRPADVDGAPRRRMRPLDVVLASDFRLPGGTNHSNAQELAIHKRLGLTTGLIQCSSRLSARPIPWSAPILAELDPDSVRPLDTSIPTRARLAILRHPVALEALPDLRSRLSVDRAMIIANQPPERPSGALEYDIPQITAIVQERLGVTPTWAPIGPEIGRASGR